MNKKSIFTVGVLVESSRVNKSKAGKPFIVLKFSDLTKYDLSKVRRHLAECYKEDKEGLKAANLAYNTNGYKTIKIMVFGDLATKVSNI